MVTAIAFITVCLFMAVHVAQKSDQEGKTIDRSAYAAWCKLQGTNLTFDEWYSLKITRTLPGTVAQ